MKPRGPQREPESLVGNCCGCNRFPRLVFKVPDVDRYRCGECFERELGYKHHLSLTDEKESADE